ncbi:flavodoxin family protein [Sporomusa sp. KB1]|jgi:anti-anti-sigma regulatory factor|uniref:flavodoxin family protein n=1 Tax=Sporomusa sp. KB1 TaxID=943346 RepID=UPI0011A4A441|nr:flavodoxin family protein [Sporomusa sp. KB1]TWH47884.1 anti-anti-sigma regulatory factor [Sporomusa sp. KB1]
MADSNTVQALALPARIDAEAAIILKSTLIKLINGGARKVICNFFATEFLSEEGAEELLQVARFLHKVGGELGICLIKPDVKATISQPQFFKFYSVEESVALVALRNLVTYFDLYEDILDLKVRMENTIAYIEIYLGFGATQTMHQVQKAVELIRHSLEQELTDVHVLIVPSTTLEEISPSQPMNQTKQIVFSSQSPAVWQLAQSIRQTIPEDIPCSSINEASAADSFDLISIVFRIDQATADSEATLYLKELHEQKLALFAVTENYPYSGYAGECMKNITALLDTSNTIAGKFICRTADNQISETDLMRARNKYFDIIQENT